MILILPGFDPAAKSYVNFKIQDINFDMLKDVIQEMVQHHGFSNDEQNLSVSTQDA
jgi:hypothetical protein